MGKLEIDDVTMCFGDVVAVDRVSLTVGEGETVVLLGPSGCGKTTLLRLIAGFNRPTAGAIRIVGQTVASPTVMVPPEKRSLSMVFQRYAAELSGGQQQRVALARALVLEPEILLFDEPLSNLDATLREHMRFEIKTLLGKLKITCIYVTHDQNEAMVVADRVAVMNRGRIEQSGTPEDVYYRSETDFVAQFIGLANVLDARIVGPVDPGLIKVSVEGV